MARDNDVERITPKPAGNCCECEQDIRTTAPELPAVKVATVGTTCGLPSCVHAAIDRREDAR